MPGLFGSSCYAVENEKKMKELGITHILTVAKYLEPCFPDMITYKCLQVEDTPRENLKPYFEECADFIENALEGGGRVVVHCEAGVSRSGTVTVAYLMRKNKWRRDEALAFTRKQRPNFSPNEGFMDQLLEYEKEIL